MEHRLLPRTSRVMALNLSGTLTHFSKSPTGKRPGITRTGLRNSPRLVRYGLQTASLVVLFHTAAGGAFLAGPLHPFFGLII